MDAPITPAPQTTTLELSLPNSGWVAGADFPGARLEDDAFVGHVLCTTLVDYRNVLLLGFGHQPEPSDVRSLTRRANQLERLYAVPLYRVARNIIATNAVGGERLIV